MIYSQKTKSENRKERVMNKEKRIGWWVFAMGLLLTGCFQFDQEMTLNADGSGNMKVHYACSEQTLGQIEMLAQMGKQQGGADGGTVTVTSNGPSFKKEEIEKEFESVKASGITLRQAAVESKDGWRHVDLLLDFKDLASLRKLELFKDSKMTLTRDAAGNYVISDQLDVDPSGTDESHERDASEKQMMTAMMQGFRAAVTIHVPGKVLESTAHEQQGQTVRWVYDLAKDPNVFDKAEKEKMRLVFEGKGLSIPELK
jgi:hypothetical protein